MIPIDELLKPTVIDGKTINVPDGEDIIKMQIAQASNEITDPAERVYVFAGRAVALCIEEYDEGAGMQVAAILGHQHPMVQACLQRCGLHLVNLDADVVEDVLPVDPSTSQQQQE